MRYESAIDLDGVTAIDTHVHIDIDDSGHHHTLPDDITEASHKYFKSSTGFPSLDKTAQYYRERSLAGVVFSINASTALNHEPVSNDEIIDGASRNNDVLIPFASVDPHQGETAISEAKRLVLDRGAQGFKFHPSVQDFDPSDEEFYPLYAALEELGKPAIFHTGQTGVGAGTRGAFGIKLGLSNPMLLDAVAANFPGLDIIMAHPSVPWQDEAISVATHKANVWIDLSGWAPRYFPPQLVRSANSLLQDRVLFGSDFPLLTPDRWLKEFAELDLKDEVRPKILKSNAVRLLGLGA